MGKIKLRIKELMAQKNVTREDLANHCEVTQASISSMTTGKNTPSMKVLVKMAERFDVDIRDLFEPSKPSNVTPRELEEAKELINRALKILNGNPEDK
jgi:transcriptional regulator with XRE-family HTH domain